MSIYNHTVLKANPLKLCIPTEGGAAFQVPVYRIRWHGKDTWFDWGEKPIGAQQWDECTFDILKRRAERSWKGQTPGYTVATSGYEGKFDWDDPYHKEHGYAVYENDLVAYQEDEGERNLIGHVFKLGRGKYKFVPYVEKAKVSPQPVDNICETRL